MIDKTKIRNKILSKIDSIDFDRSLESKLDSLTLFNAENNLDMHTFYTDFFNIIGWSEIDSIQYCMDQEFEIEEFQKLLHILAWAKSQWKNSIENGNLDKTIVAFIIVERLFLLPEQDLIWNTDFSRFTEKLKEILLKINYDVSDKLSDFADYSDKKFHSDYKNSIETNNYRGFFIFFDALERGVGIHSEEEEFIKALIRINSLVDIQFLSDNIGSYSPILILLIFKTLNKSNKLELIEKYRNKRLLPLLIATREIFKKDITEEVTTDWVYIERCCIVLEKINERVSEESLY